MPCRSMGQVEHMFRLNMLNRQRYVDRVLSSWGYSTPQDAGKQHTLEEFMSSVTPEALRRWWADRALRPGHSAAADDTGRRYLRFIDCRAGDAAAVERHLNALGWDCGTVPLPDSRLAVYVRPREE